MSLMAKRESISRRLAGMNLPRETSDVFALFQVKSSPPLRPPPNKMVSSLSRASAGPRVFPPPVTALEIDFELKVKSSEPSGKSAAFAGATVESRSADTSRTLLTMRKTLGFGALVGKLKASGVHSALTVSRSFKWRSNAKWCSIRL